MISSASTLLLATLVFNAASVLGAPIRIADTSSVPVARAELSTPVAPVVARAAIIDVQDNRRRSQLGSITRRLVRLSERDEPLPEAVVARAPEPAVDSSERRYPRRVYHDLYAREPEPKPAVPVVAPVVESRERRYPRRVYHDIYVKREPATSIKETTKTVEKVTILDTPADIAAFNAANGANSPFASASGVKASVTTISSSSQTTTILASGSVPTPAPTADSSASASASGDAASTSASASASASASDATSSATSTAASGEPTPTATDASSAEPTPTSAAGAEPTPTDSSSSSEPKPTASGDPAASATSSAPSGEPTDAPPSSDASGGDPKPAVTVDGTTTPSDGSTTPADPTARDESSGDITEARRGIYVKASTAPIVRRLATSGASWASSVRRQLNTY